jgi:hypothetical protein
MPFGCAAWRQAAKEANDRIAVMKELGKRMIRRLTWAAKRKNVKKVLALRCRRDGLPEHGRFTSRDIERIVALEAGRNDDEKPDGLSGKAPSRCDEVSLR